jgi:hypothetical protein
MKPAANGWTGRLPAEGELGKVVSCVQGGISSPEHLEFVRRLNAER